jgi:hypothetical protein
VAPPKRKSGGRTTPKGTKPGQLPTAGHAPRYTNPSENEQGVAASSRYTPPVPMSMKVSPPWVPVLMFALFIIGALLILFYYLGWVPGGRSNWYLLAGLLCVLGGLYTATKYH